MAILTDGCDGRARAIPAEAPEGGWVDMWVVGRCLIDEYIVWTSSRGTAGRLV